MTEQGTELGASSDGDFEQSHPDINSEFVLTMALSPLQAPTPLLQVVLLPLRVVIP